LIRCALGLDEHGGKAAQIAGNRWTEWVNAYAADFSSRNIVPDSLPFTVDGYIDGATQERLLLGPGAGGDSNVSDSIEGALTFFAMNTCNVYGVAMDPTRHQAHPIRAPQRPSIPIDPHIGLHATESSRLAPKQLATHRRLYSSIPHGLEDAFISYARPAWLELIAAHEQKDSRALGLAIDSILTLPARGLVQTTECSSSGASPASNLIVNQLATLRAPAEPTSSSNGKLNSAVLLKSSKVVLCRTYVVLCRS
jgi:hypothetical protein